MNERVSSYPRRARNVTNIFDTPLSSSIIPTPTVLDRLLSSSRLRCDTTRTIITVNIARFTRTPLCTILSPQLSHCYVIDHLLLCSFPSTTRVALHILTM
jgi:hypothetical protein